MQNLLDQIKKAFFPQREQLAAYFLPVRSIIFSLKKKFFPFIKASGGGGWIWP